MDTRHGQVSGEKTLAAEGVAETRVRNASSAAYSHKTGRLCRAHKEHSTTEAPTRPPKDRALSGADASVSLPHSRLACTFTGPLSSRWKTSARTCAGGGFAPLSPVSYL